MSPINPQVIILTTHAMSASQRYPPAEPYLKNSTTAFPLLYIRKTVPVLSSIRKTLQLLYLFVSVLSTIPSKENPNSISS